MNLVKGMLVVGAVALGCAAPTSAQERPEPYSRAYVSASAGSTINDDTTMVVAVEYGERVGSLVRAYVNFAYYDDLMSGSMRDSLAGAASLLSEVTGSRWQLAGRDRGLALTFGAKVPLWNRGAVRPYVGGGAGALAIRRTIVEQSRGDVTTSFVSEFGVADGRIASSSLSTTKPLAEAVAGVGIFAGRTYIDVGYRYRRAFHTLDDLDFSQLGAAVSFRF